MKNELKTEYMTVTVISFLWHLFWWWWSLVFLSGIQMHERVIKYKYIAVIHLQLHFMLWTHI